MTDAEILALSEQLGRTLQARGLVLGTAESCTGGLVAGAVTAVAGSSAWFDRGFVTYTNEAKVEHLGVAPQTLAEHGAVSEQVARQMATGVLAACPGVQLAVSTTGIAGPGGAVPGKPVGTVCFGVARRGDDGLVVCAATRHFEGDRARVRRDSVHYALSALLQLLASRQA